MAKGQTKSPKKGMVDDEEVTMVSGYASDGSQSSGSSSGSSSSSSSGGSSRIVDLEADDVQDDDMDVEDLQAVASSQPAQSSSKWPSSDSRPFFDTTKSRSKLHQTAKALRSLAKKTKTFEVQKLVKKLKQSGDKALEAELEALKAVDTALLAGRALTSKMVKAKLLPRGTGEEEDFPFLLLVRDEPLLGEESLKRTDTSKAEARILSSKVLADEVASRIQELGDLAGIDSAGKKPAKKPIKEDKNTKKKETAAKKEVAKKGKQKEVEEDRVWSGSESDASIEADDASGSEDEEEGDESELERIGREKVAALGDLSQWDDLIGSDSEAKPSNKRSRSVSASSDDDESDSEDEVDSHFLPSLATGFIGGRSDDDWSDAEADLADRDLDDLKSGPKKKKERKNRQGQRARKASYERKYGKNANHLKLFEKERKKVPVYGQGEKGQGEKGQGWGKRVALPPQEDSKPKLEGGVDMRRTRGGGRVAGMPRQAALPPQTRVAPAPRPAPKPAPAPPAPAQEMHPSWIAKQKQKELAAQVKPAGKKITFD